MTRELRPLGRVWFDIIGKIPVKSIHGYQYTLILVDEATGQYCARCLTHRKDIFEAIAEWKKEVETHWSMTLGDVGLSPKVIRFASDGAGENKSNALADFCKENGIKHTIGTAYEHAQMGKVERAIRTIWEGGSAACRRFSPQLLAIYGSCFYICPKYVTQRNGRPGGQ